MAVSTLDSLSTNGGVYLTGIANDFGGAQAAQMGQDAAANYLRNLSRGANRGVLRTRRVRLMVALSATALVLASRSHKEPNNTPTKTTSTSGVGCTITVSKTNGGPEGAWGIAKKVAPPEERGTVFDYLAPQQRERPKGVLEVGDVLVAPPIACSSDATKPISQEPAE